MPRDFSDLLRASNQRLIDFNVGISIEQRGHRLYLRGTFPPKPGSKKIKPHQQNIALGVFANPDGLKFTEKEAKKVGMLLACGEFDWSPYLGRKAKSREPESPEEAIANFEKHYFSTRKDNPTTRQTFKHEYLSVFAKLSDFSIEEMKQIVLATEPDTRNRRRHALAFACMADYLGLEHGFRALTGKYSVRKIKPKDIPTDEAIAKAHRSIEDSAWAWAFGLQACYGLRNHEIFHVDVSRFPLVQVNEGKTGSRIVFPFYLEWAEQWRLSQTNYPDCSGATNSDFGNRVTHAYKRLGVGFNPYALRHAWAVRSIKFGLHPTLAAQQMGHDPETHYQHYQNWIDADVHFAEFDRVMSRGDRPMPPSGDR
jgi:integrase